MESDHWVHQDMQDISSQLCLICSLLSSSLSCYIPESFDLLDSAMRFVLSFSLSLSLSPTLQNPQQNQGREWIANGMCSFFISFLTYQVYANMTRFEWAYPSGVEDVRNQWISGQSMILFVVAMNMTYLVTETRTKIGEKGINDPPIKLLVTVLTFLGLFGLQVYEVVDPSVLEAVNTTETNDYTFDTNRPLKGVCYTKSLFSRGLGILFIIVCGCVGFVVFVTSRQTLSGLRSMCCTRTSRVGSGNSGSSNSTGIDSSNRTDLIMGRLALFVIYVSISIFIVMFFAIVPLYNEGGTRNETGWIEICDRGDFDELRAAGL